MEGLLRSLSMLRLHDAQSAEDVVQETFLAAQVNIDALMKKPNPKGWLVGVLKNKIYHENRAKQRYRFLYQKLEQSYQAPQTEDGYFEGDILDKFNKKEYEILKLVYIDGHSPFEVAEILGISYETCRKRIQTAKRNFLQEFD